MSQEAITRILTAEQQAVRIHDDALKQVANLIDEAERAASSLQEQILTQAHRQAGQIATEAQEAAGAERESIIAQAETEAQQLEALAARHFDRATAFVLDRVAGRA